MSRTRSSITRIVLLAALAAPGPALAATDAAKEKAEMKAAFTKINGKLEEAKKSAAEKSAADKTGATSRELETKKCVSFADDYADFGKKYKSAEGYHNAGVLYSTCGNDQKKAEAMWREALQLKPDYAPAHVNIGEAAYKAGLTSVAQAEFDTALRADPKNVQAYNGAALMLIEKARAAGNDKTIYAEAIGKLRRALAVDGDSMPAYALLALIYYTVAESDRSKLDLAELVCTQAKSVNANYAPIYNTLGLIKLRKKNVTGALTEFRKAAELEPSYVEAQLNIAAITLSARDYATAEKAFKAALDANPKVPQQVFDATMGMGVSARGQKRFDEAIQWYQKAKALDPKNCSVIYNTAILHQDYLLKDAPIPQLPPNLVTARAMLSDFLACGNSTKDKLDDAKGRIVIIDKTGEALKEAKRAEEEAERAIEEAKKLEKEAFEQACKQWVDIVKLSIKQKQPIPPPFVPGCPPLPEGLVPAGMTVPPYVDPNAPPPPKADKPADKPADKAAVADKPAEKPAEKAAEKPAEKPAAAPAAADKPKAKAK